MIWYRHDDLLFFQLIAWDATYRLLAPDGVELHDDVLSAQSTSNEETTQHLINVNVNVKWWLLHHELYGSTEHGVYSGRRSVETAASRAAMW